MAQNSSRNLWEDITEVYERARASGVAYKTDTNTQLLRDPKYDVEFVLRVAIALRDKPKPPKDRHGALKLWYCGFAEQEFLKIAIFKVERDHLTARDFVTQCKEGVGQPISAL